MRKERKEKKRKMVGTKRKIKTHTTKINITMLKKKKSTVINN